MLLQPPHILCVLPLDRHLILLHEIRGLRAAKLLKWTSTSASLPRDPRHAGDCCPLLTSP
ncbi:hypothetical protein E2C01_012116 [Portunus trituberculatus]|uniref:Uncharacterized protein n=1 Tax=Portunus trituberculatus TaxID=210409 RepID=A0A5B7DDR6_PORTR|nr:hypothetical protein [Portunus trituberculatus]